MADLRRMHLTISKGMKLTCTVEQALEDVIVVSLKHKAKEFRGILMDASERHLPPGLCFNQDSGSIKTEGENSGNSSTDGPEQPQIKELRGVTLDCRYSYNNDPAKYNEQPLPAASAISIRPARGKQVRNIRLRPRQTLCSKCKAAIHDSKSKSPNKNPKTEGEGQDQEAHPHNTRFRAAQSGKPTDGANAAAGPTLRSGAKNRRSDSTPKVLLENIRPKRDVKPTAKKKDADAAAQRKQSESTARKSAASEEQSSDSSGAKSDLLVKQQDRVNFGKREDETLRVMMERSVSLDNPSALSQYNKQPVVRLDKTAVNNMNYRPEVKEEKQEKAPTISIVNIRSTPAIKISYGGAGDRDVVKIPPRLPGAELKSPDSQSTADESPAPVSPAPPPSPPQKKTKKASKRTRDKQRYRIVNEGDSASEMNAQGIKIVGHHRKHKRKHRHRHASSEDENFNSEVGAPPPAKQPAIITKFSVVPPVNDMNGNEKKSDSEVLKDSSNETPTRQDEPGEGVNKSPREGNELHSQVRSRREGAAEFTFNSDPLSLRAEFLDAVPHDTSSVLKSPSCGINRPKEFINQFKAEIRDGSPARSDTKAFEMWGSPAKIEAPTFEMDGSPDGIEAPPFQSDDSQDGLIIGPLTLGNSPGREDDQLSCDSLSVSPPPVRESREDREVKEGDGGRKESVPYGVGVFEDLTPDEDEDDHQDHNVSQPMYQLPLAKKPRMMYGGWARESLSPAPSVPSYLSKKSAAVLSESYPNRSRMYQNGPSSYFAPSPGSSSMYPPDPSTVFPHNPAPRIQNSPTPMIHKSPVPIFNYHSSRYQGSPNRRFGSSPSRRYHSINESASSRTHSIIEGTIRHSSHGSHSRYQGHESEPYTAARDSHSSSSGRYVSRAESEMPHPASSSRFHPNKFESRSTIRYQPPSEKSTGSIFTSPPESSSVPRLSAVEDTSSSGTKPYRAGERSSTLQYVSSPGDAGSVPRFAVPRDSNHLASQYPSQGSTGSLQRYPSHPVEGSLPNQYPSLGSTDSRYQPHSDGRYKPPNSANIPSPLSLQSNSRSSSGSMYPPEKDRKNSASSAACYETVDTSALFMTHSLGHNAVPSNDNSSVPNYLSKPLSQSSSSSSSQIPAARVPSSESAKSSHMFSAIPGQSASVSFLRQDPSIPKLVAGGDGGQSVVFHSAGSNSSSGSSSITRHASSSSLSQGHLPVMLSDSEDDSDNAVPGFVPTPGMLGSGSRSEDISRMPMMKIHSQNLSSCMTGEGREIRVGDVQWGKVQGFPWWPCRIMTIKMTHRDHREQDLIVTQVCHVSWFGSSTVSDLPPSELRPFREEFMRRHNKKKRGPYQVAVQQAMMATELTTLSAPDASRAHSQQPLSLGLMHDLVS
ncbi:hypothetical protein V1264_014753 [Littorina saxatilis]|uniref:PWWP domain-containing protein n=2 Tax=Littorina saxatilis TaxID=31220 RepID=A0AAN9BTP1_9CAEN